MRTILRRLLPVLVLLLLLTPVAVFAQSETAAQLIDLVFSEDESSVQIEETIQSVARVTFTHDGKTYVLKAPVTIEVDSTIPLEKSALITDTASRVGVYAIEILSVTEPDEVQVGYSEVEPSGNDSKLVVVFFRLTNLHDESKRLYGHSVFGVDDMGRQFDVEALLGCDDVNPGVSTECYAVFDVQSAVKIVALELHVLDERVLPLPDVDDEEAEEE